MRKTVIVLMVVTLCSKIIGFSRELILSYFYGASNISDAYLISTTIPATIFAFIGVGISTSFIPMYNKINIDHNEKDSKKFMNNIINFLMIFCIIIISIVFINTKFFVQIFASGFDYETLKLAITLTRISILGILFTTFVYIFNSFLQIKGNFLIPALTGIPLNIVIITSIILSYYYELYYLAIGSVVAALAQFILLLPSVKKENYKYHFRLNFKDKYTKEFIILSLPVILGVSVNQINVLVDRTIASRIVSGGVSSLVYADRLMVFIQGIFVTTLLTVIYPKISTLAAKKDLSELKKVITNTFKLTLIVLLPMTSIVLIYSKEIISILFGRGEFDVKAIALTSTALFYYGVGILGIAIREIFSKSFYAFQDTKTPIINAGISVMINIFLNLILSKYLGIGGLALATSISAIISAFLMYSSFQKKFGDFKNTGMNRFTFKIIFSTIGMVATSIMFKSLFSQYLNDFLTLICSIVISIFVFVLMLFVLKVEEIKPIINQSKRGKKDE